MSYTTKLLIDGREIDVLKYRFGFKKRVDIHKRPDQTVSFRGLEMTVASTDDTFFEEWMASQKPKERIELHIYYPYLDEGSCNKMVFYDCYLIHHQTIFSANNNEPMKEELKLTCAGIKTPNSQIEYETAWRKTYDKPQQVTKVMPIDNTGDLILKCAYFEDAEGNLIKEKYEGKAFLVIETDNNIGKKVSFNLADRDHNFKYKGKILEDDILEDITITGDITKVELEIIKEENNG